jgi:hypothetical protein
MTYRKLRKYLQEMDDLRLDDDVTIYDSDRDEFLPANRVTAVDEDGDVLDEGHTIILI